MAARGRTDTLIPLIVVIGPTASGKSDLVNKLARDHTGEVVNADSRQVYTDFSIGTNKELGQWINYENRQRYVVDGIVYHLIDFVFPEANFSVYEYQKRAHSAILEIVKRGKVPLLSGGTGMYIDAVVDNWMLSKDSYDETLRKELSGKSNIELLRRLESSDLASAKKIDPHNKSRLIRAVEILELTGAPKGSAPKVGPQLYESLKIGISVDREKLYAKINSRVDVMIERGLIEEVEDLSKRYSKALPVFFSIGYKEILDYLAGDITKDKAIESIKTNTRRYAKRQMTWWRRDKKIIWCDSQQEAERFVRQFLDESSGA